MTLFNRALTKLSIEGYKDLSLRERVGRIEAMYNPAELTLDYAALYQPSRALNDVSNANVFVDAPPGTLSVELVFDGHLPGNHKPVDQQLTELRQLCGIVDGVSRQTRYLKVQWGQLSWHGDGYFAGRMQRLAVRYSLFDRDGSPLRAHATLTLLEDRDPTLQRAKKGLVNPPRAFAHVPDLPTLPLIASAALTAGSVMHDKGAVDYLALAVANDLDHLDAMQPGDVLQWPISHRGSTS